jgi:hypothetical protein
MTPLRGIYPPALLFCLCLATLADATDMPTSEPQVHQHPVPGARITDARESITRADVGSWEDPITRVSHGRLDGASTSIDVPGAVYTTALDINDAGDIVGSYEGPPPGELFGDVHGFC